MISRKKPLAKAIWGLGIATIVLYSVSQFDPGGIVAGLSDKFAHFLAYFVTALVGYLAASVQRHRLQIAGGMMVLGLLLEVIQLYVPGRAFETADWLADIGGVAVAYAVYRMVRRKV